MDGELALPEDWRALYRAAQRTRRRERQRRNAVLTLRLALAVTVAVVAYLDHSGALDRWAGGR